MKKRDIYLFVGESSSSFFSKSVHTFLLISLIEIKNKLKDLDGLFVFTYSAKESLEKDTLPTETSAKRDLEG